MRTEGRGVSGTADDARESVSVASGRSSAPTAALSPSAERRWERRVFWYSFAARFGVGVLGWAITELFDLPFLQDALYYEEVGAHVADDWLAGHSSEWLSQAIDRGTGGWGLVIVIACFYCLTGGLRLLPLLIAGYCALTSWTPVVVYRIGLRLGAPISGARIGAWLVALSPAFAFWSGALYKEGLILLLLSLIVYHALILQEASRGRSLLILAFCLPALFAVRFYLAAMFTVALVLGLLLARERRSTGTPGGAAFLRQFLVVLIVGAVLFGIGFTDRITQMLPDDLEQALGKVHSSRRDLAAYPSGYLRDADVSTPAAALQFLPIGLVYFLATPFPWQLGTLRQNLAIPETAFWVLLYPLIFVGLKQAWRTHRQGALLLILLTGLTCCFYGIYCGNVGVAYRMRIQVWVLWAPLIGWGWVVVRPNGRSRRAA